MEYNWSLLLVGMGFTAGLIGGWTLAEIMNEYEQRKNRAMKHYSRRR
jgi:hypothetical protein